MFRQTIKPAGEVDAAGGAYVRRRFEMADRQLVAGDTLSAEELRAIPRVNLDALINTGMLEVYPAAPAAGSASAGAKGGQRFPVHIGGGRYLVIEGSQLTPEPISRDEAEALVAAGAQPTH